MIGTHLGPYEIVAKLGAGGMGEVWRARDPKLERDVAIKLLPDELAADPERIARFEREAKLLAQLNHNNIATIFGLEEDAGRRFIVMELVDGVSLADRIAGRSAAEAKPGAGLAAGRMAINDALDIARQIAEALEAAHANGVIHRDLKPANIMLTESGRVKVLDFGLAKAYQADGSESGIRPEISPDISNSPTIVNATRTGVIMGTAAYMSPEQASGTAVDKRTDIWAFGVVLFEMLSGRRLFEGETAAHVMADVLKTEPDLANLEDATPQSIRRLLRRCLQKKPHDRLHDIADARIVVGEVLAGDAEEALGSGSLEAARRGRSMSMALVVPAVLAVAASAALIGWWAADRTGANAVPPTAFEIDALWPDSVTISPDGRTIAYGARTSAEDGRQFGLFIRRLGEADAVRIVPEDPGPGFPAFSPDGKTLAYWVFDDDDELNGAEDARLRTVSLADGMTRDVLDGQPISSVYGGLVWDTETRLIFVDDARSLVAVAPAGGEPQTVWDPGDAAGDERVRFRLLSQVLPDGRYLYTGERERIVVGSPVDQSITVVAEDGRNAPYVEGGRKARYVEPGYLFFYRDGALWAAPFDREETRFLQPPVVVRQGVAGRGYDISATGTLAYLAGAHFEALSTEDQLIWIDRQGGSDPLPLAPRDILGAPRLSPDGGRVVFSARDGGADIYVFNLEGGGERRLTFDGRNTNPVWSSDGEWIYFSAAADADGERAIRRLRPDFSDEPEKVFQGRSAYPLQLTADDSALLISVRGNWGDIGLLPLDGSSEPRMLLDSDRHEVDATLSPDGTMLAYASDETGPLRVYVLDRETGRTRSVVAEDGTNPRWSTDGSRLYYTAQSVTIRREAEDRTTISFSGDAVQKYVQITRDADGVSAGSPERFIESPDARQDPAEAFDVAPDGRMLATDQPFRRFFEESRLIVVVNWLDEVKRLLAEAAGR